MTKQTGGPAFPCEGVVTNDGILYEGMTLRDYFAAKAMQSAMGTPELNKQSTEEIAIGSYRIADAMLKAREL
jgi:hypothetical protein